MMIKTALPWLARSLQMENTSWWGILIIQTMSTVTTMMTTVRSMDMRMLIIPSVKTFIMPIILETSTVLNNYSIHKSYNHSYLALLVINSSSNASRDFPFVSGRIFSNINNPTAAISPKIKNVVALPRLDNSHGNIN